MAAKPARRSNCRFGPYSPNGMRRFHNQIAHV